MGKKQRHFDVVFKRRLVAEIESGERTQAQVAREEHISPSLLQRWRNQVGSGTLIDRPTARERALEKELERYKKKRLLMASKVTTPPYPINSLNP